jgi:hypothetical protein
MPITSEVFAVFTMINAVILAFSFGFTIYLFTKAYNEIKTKMSKYEHRLNNIISRMEH